MVDLTPETMQMIAIAVAAICLMAVIYIVASPYLSGQMQAEKRIQGVTEAKVNRSQRRVKEEEVSNRRKQVSETLKELEDKQKQTEKVTLRLRLQRAGLDVTPNVFWGASGVCGAVLALVVLVFVSSNPLIIGAAAFVGVLGIPRWVVKKMTLRRQSKFINEFANAIDVIVRGVKTGLPLNECLGIIARESPSPIKEEFQELVEQTRVGIPLADCFDRMMQRTPLAEVKFFSIVIGIQSQAGGNLSEALGNLAGVLRDRKRLQAKVKALSAEAKASAGVLGALPFCVMGMVYLSTPDYIKLLFITKRGNLMLLGAAIWMSMGLLTMRKMINFKY